MRERDAPGVLSLQVINGERESDGLCVLDAGLASINSGKVGSS